MLHELVHMLWAIANNRLNFRTPTLLKIRSVAIFKVELVLYVGPEHTLRKNNLK